MSLVEIISLLVVKSRRATKFRPTIFLPRKCQFIIAEPFLLAGVARAMKLYDFPKCWAVVLTNRVREFVHNHGANHRRRRHD